MSKLNFKGQKGKNNKKGLHFYTALGICIVAVGIAAYTTYDSINRFAGRGEDIIASKTQQKYRVQNSDGKNSNQSEQNRQSASGGSINNTANGSQHTNPRPDKNKESKESIKKMNTEAPSSVVYPASKDITKKFSGDNPVYSKTLNDWRVHNGIDLAAEAGSKIKAITGGKVKQIYNDELMGTTIEIEHEGGFSAFYCGLDSATLVKSGDTVKPGQEIASLSTVPCETADGTHLHLAIKKDDKFVDPTETLGS